MHTDQTCLTEAQTQMDTLQLYQTHHHKTCCVRHNSQQRPLRPCNAKIASDKDLRRTRRQLSTRIQEGPDTTVVVVILSEMNLKKQSICGGMVDFAKISYRFLLERTYRCVCTDSICFMTQYVCPAIKFVICSIILIRTKVCIRTNLLLPCPAISLNQAGFSKWLLIIVITGGRQLWCGSVD